MQAGGYVGAGLGQGNTSVDQSFDGSDTAYKIFGGYRFIRFFGLEADYRDFGAHADDTAQMEADTSAFDLWAVGVVPIGSFEVFGKAGYSMWESQLRDPINGAEEFDGNDLAFGLGAAYKISKFAIRLEFEQFQVEDTDNVSMATVGVDFRF